ncbi:hypothetical protein JK358_33220 [Nocardia sp. 2]|uniref:Uncharacterized protein n=1 Tax=Nocardia acididurans TaxID=2802282 RepID=A0ABS1MG91_9NOCA|nr:hypothetical protein [Nocardia acididurans]MBL1079279.1 hypothetical protein [Nocardia acididurans]
MRGMRSGVAGAASAAVLMGVVLGAPPALADPPPVVQFGFHNGYCSTFDLNVPANTPFFIDVDTSFQFTDMSEFRIPALKIRVILPSAYFNPHARVEVPAQPPGPIPFEAMTPTTTGSAGKGCWGTIHVW